MTPFVQTITDLLSIATLFGMGAILFLVFVIMIRLTGKRYSMIDFIFSIIKRYAVAFGFFISLSAVAASLFYSETAGFRPCVLCWWQRIFMYPQAILFGYALVKKNSKVVYYSLLMSAIGASIAAYHTYIQFAGSPFFTCTTDNPCTQRYFLEFGFVTIPTMALTSFLLLLLIMVVAIMTQRPRSAFHAAPDPVRDSITGLY